MSIKVAKDRCAEQLIKEGSAKDILQRSAQMNGIDDHGDSTTIAVAIVKAEESGLVDEVTLDSMWELQVF